MGGKNSSVRKQSLPGHDDVIIRLERSLRAIYDFQRERDKLPKDERDKSEVSQRLRLIRYNLREVTITGDDLYDLYLKNKESFKTTIIIFISLIENVL